MAALYSVESLAYDLAADDFHLKIRAERPDLYPARQRISIDESLWMFPCEEYDPPYFVAPEVLANDFLTVPDGWADPEDFERVKDDPSITSVKFHDEDGRPLNPRGRTGIAGRGSLGRWGKNESVFVLVLRIHEAVDQIDLLLGTGIGSRVASLPNGFKFPREEDEGAIARIFG